MDLNTQLDTFIKDTLHEDIGSGDHTSLACVDKNKRDKSHLLIKDAGIVAGVAVAKRIFETLDPDCTFNILIEDGSDVHYGDIVFEMECNTQALLKGERLALNTMQRMSGIATLSNRFKFEVEDLPVQLLDTRKTTPGIRFLEKWGVRLGGCSNYRDGLYDRFMVKDNHIDACGGVKEAIQNIQAYKKENNLDIHTTIEVRNLVELHEVLEVGMVERIMLDNFELPLMQEAVETINGRFEVEASGNMDIHKVRKVAQTGVGFISIGALTHSATSLDMSLKVVK